jgi:hypothetical protein
MCEEAKLAPFAFSIGFHNKQIISRLDRRSVHITQIGAIVPSTRNERENHSIADGQLAKAALIPLLA